MTYFGPERKDIFMLSTKKLRYSSTRYLNTTI